MLFHSSPIQECLGILPLDAFGVLRGTRHACMTNFLCVPLNPPDTPCGRALASLYILFSTQIYKADFSIRLAKHYYKFSFLNCYGYSKSVIRRTDFPHPLTYYLSCILFFHEAFQNRNQKDCNDTVCKTTIIETEAAMY